MKWEACIYSQHTLKPVQSHTILGSRSQRGLTQLSLDVLYQNLDEQLASTSHNNSVFQSLSSVDTSESQLFSAGTFLESVYGDGETKSHSRNNSRAGTPLLVSLFFSSN